MFTVKELESHHRSGFAVPIGQNAVILEPPAITPAPSTPEGAVDAHDMPTTEGKSVDPLAMSTDNPSGVNTSTSSTEPEKTAQAPVSVWTFDPANLEGKDLDTLKTMAAERDESAIDDIDAMDLKSLIHFMTKDFQPEN